MRNTYRVRSKSHLEIALDFGVFLGHVDTTAVRPAFKFLAKRRQRSRRTNGVDFHSTVAQILRVAVVPSCRASRLTKNR